MSLATVKDLVTSKGARQLLLAKKHSPRILFVAGTVGVVGATVLACRATLKVTDILDDHDKAKVGLQVRHEDNDTTLASDNRKLQLYTGLQIAKLYAPAVVLGGISVAALTGAHVTLTRRNAGVMAAYAALDRAHKQYRQQVANEYGEDIDRKFAMGGEDVEVVERTSDGKIKTTNHVKAGRSGASPYAVIFDEHSSKFTREPGMNAMLVQMQQNWANEKLRAQGHLFLNEVHDMLGLPRTKAGAMVGWVWRRETEEKTGDNYVSFGVFDGDRDVAEAFIDGDESSIWLDFNVDGIILDLI